MATKKYYAVRVGRKTGIFKTWDQCSASINGYPGAIFKGFMTLKDAEAYMGDNVIKTNNISNTIDKNNRIYKFDANKFNSESQAYYVVRCGREIGIFMSWADCEKQVKGYSGAQYKKIVGTSNALEYLRQGNIKVEIVKKENKEKCTKKINKEGYDVEYIKSKAKVKSSIVYVDPSNINKDYEFIAFIDGSYDKVNKIYGSGLIVIKDNLTEYEVFYEAGYDKWNQWNIVGELEATKLALKKAEEVGAKNVAIYHDLKNISLWATGEWKARNKYTQEYVRLIEEYSKKLNIYFIKVKAHSNESIYNDLADEAAKSAIERYLAESKCGLE